MSRTCFGNGIKDDASAEFLVTKIGDDAGDADKVKEWAGKDEHKQLVSMAGGSLDGGDQQPPQVGTPPAPAGGDTGSPALNTLINRAGDDKQPAHVQQGYANIASMFGQDLGKGGAA